MATMLTNAGQRCTGRSDGGQSSAMSRASVRRGVGQGERRVFGLSLSKLLFTILVVVAVWKGFALIGRLARERQADAVGGRPGGHRRTPSQRTIELVECPRCGAYFDPGEGCKCNERRA
jgi:hypothetical protein